MSHGGDAVAPAYDRGVGWRDLTLVTSNGSAVCPDPSALAAPAATVGQNPVHQVQGMNALPDLPGRCVGCPSTAVRIIVVGGHQVWACQDCERLLVRPAVTAGSPGRVF